ncbi:MAG: hypothetical protein ACREF7_01875 [Candidatus Saccharimonadales bacterium]
MLQSRIKNRWLEQIILVAGLVVVFSITMASASASPLITEGFNTTQNLNIGSIVSLVSNNQNSVVASTTNNARLITGVVISSNSAQVSLSSGTNQVQVATSGINQVLVSDMNGAIAAGEEITASPISGVGMLATDNAEVIGSAQGSFPNTTASKETINTSSGKQKVNIGDVPVLVNVGYYTKQPTKTLIPTAIQNLANAVAGKTVKTLPIIISAVIFIITLVVVVSIVYSLIHGSIISVGRNPMAQTAIYRNVMQLSALVIAIIAVALFAIFMILTRLS